MGNGCTPKQVCLMNQLRMLWMQHVYWTRFFIVSTLADLGDLKAATDRLLQNPGDFARLFMPFYGSKTSAQFQKLFTEHLLIAADLVNAAKAQQADEVAKARKKWYQNADDLAEFLSAINPFWSESTWRSMLYSHLEMTEKEAVLRLEGKYPADVANFDSIEKEAMKMADYMFCGMKKQFRLCG